MRAVQAFAIALCLAFPFVLSACGGGGGDGTAATADPTPTPAPTDTPEPVAMSGAPELRTPLTSSLTPQEAFDRITNRTNNTEGTTSITSYGPSNRHLDRTYRDERDEYIRDYLYKTLLPNRSFHQPLGSIHSFQDELNGREAIFNTLYDSLTPYEKYNNRWTGIYMAHTDRICTTGTTTSHPWGSCASNNPADLKDNMIAVDDEAQVNFHDSTMGYLDYSAFILEQSSFGSKALQRR